MTGSARTQSIIPNLANNLFANNKDARKAAAVLNPLKRPRNVASDFSSRYCAVAARENGSEIEKNRIEKKMVETEIHFISDEPRTYWYPRCISLTSVGCLRRDLRL